MENAPTDLYLRASGILRKFYGYTNFRPMQYQIIEHVMNGGDAVVLMPTGGGKSICYQIPALLLRGKCTIVVSPLLSLMKDQVDALLSMGIPAAAVNSQQSENQNREIIENAYKGIIKLIYISPERLLTEVNEWSLAGRIGLIAIDEAHCISQWGHDFRPEYTQLTTLKRLYPDIPVMALTATADRLTRDDIKKQLNIPDAKMFITSFDRPNISLNVQSEISGRKKVNMIAGFIERHAGQSGIIYCTARKSTEALASKLKGLGINAEAFHAGLPTDTKIDIQQRFINDDVQVICATIAFGMGIDKSNVRWVIHNNMPKNIEGYYQEIGRAGRDGLRADALMFYSYGDVVTLMSFAKDSGQSVVNMEKLRRMQQYAESTVCRRRILLSYFNERYEHDCGNCDVCNNPPERFDATILAQMALSAIMRTGEQAGMISIIDILRGSKKAELIAAGWDKLKTHGVGHDLSFATWSNYMLQMLQLGLFDIAYQEGNHLKVTNYGRDVLFNGIKVLLAKYEYGKRLSKTKEKTNNEVRSEMNASLLSQLKDLRRAIAKAQGVFPYIVFSDKVLHVIATEKPTTRIQFGTLYGVGERKTELYWRQFTSLIKKWNDEHNRPSLDF